MKNYRELLEGVGPKPKGGDILKTIYGQDLKIATVSRGVVYADEPGKMERYIVPVTDVVSVGRGIWKETMGGA